jgi:hypothetical protein
LISKVIHQKTFAELSAATRTCDIESCQSYNWPMQTAEYSIPNLKQIVFDEMALVTSVMQKKLGKGS